MFAPVVHRFRTYAIEVSGEARHYYEAMQALPAFQEWTRAGLAETLVIERFDATIDVTPDMRGQIKIVAFQRGVTVADMLRELLAREFPPTEGGTP